jgi:hypothetical protein
MNKRIVFAACILLTVLILSSCEVMPLTGNPF